MNQLETLLTGFLTGPLKFRAVDPSTGRASEPFEFRPGVRGLGPAAGIDHWSFRHTGFDLPESDAEPILCVWSGFEAIGKREIYVGDVLLNDFGTLDVVVWLDGMCRVATLRYDNQPIPLTLGDTEGLEDHYHRVRVVGNRWEQPDVLRKRAEQMDAEGA